MPIWVTTFVADGQEGIPLHRGALFYLVGPTIHPIYKIRQAKKDGLPNKLACPLPVSGHIS